MGVAGGTADHGSDWERVQTTPSPLRVTLASRRARKAGRRKGGQAMNRRRVERLEQITIL
jgi:hypothetical protein